MKNFPHQINQLSRLNAALRIFVTLADAAAEVGDDGVVGDALARSRVYTFRNPGDRAIQQLLADEHSKPIGSQGTRAAARDLRRFFALLGFVDRHETGEWRVSAPARELLELDPDTDGPRLRELWREALLDLELDDQAGNVSHPYRILLRLVAEVPGLPKPYSGLCLEAADDSAGEFSRIIQIARSPDPMGTMTALAGEHMSRNSVKILPSMAIQLGDLFDSNGRLNVTNWVSDAMLDPRRARSRDAVIRNLVRRPFTPRSRLSAGPRRAIGSPVVVRRYDVDLLGARYNDHEDCLDRFTRLFPEGVQRFEAIYDLIAVKPGAVMLVEAKTIRSDERAQVRIAVGQIYYYEHFEVAPLYPGSEIKRLLLTDRPLGAELCQFLTACQIGVVWLPPNGRLGGSNLGLDHLEQFGIGR